jgi:hypothetical protein
LMLCADPTIRITIFLERKIKIELINFILCL